MYWDAFVWGLVATLGGLGCAGSNGLEAKRPSALTYTTTWSSSSGSTEAPPTPSPKPGPPRLVRSTTDTPPADRASRATGSDPDNLRVRGLGIGGGPTPTVEPAMTVAAPPTSLPFPPRAGVEAALAAVPNGAPLGRLDRDALEGPLRDRARFARCALPAGTRARIDALIYNGAAVGVDVHTSPRSQPLEFCIEQVVRETSWVKEVAANRVSLTL